MILNAMTVHVACCSGRFIQSYKNSPLIADSSHTKNDVKVHRPSCATAYLLFSRAVFWLFLVY
jgi:hypothetical protein